MSDPNEECPSALHRQMFVVDLSHLVQAVIQCPFLPMVLIIPQYVVE